MWIEVFKSGEHTDSAGEKKTFTEDMLDEIAGKYNGKVKESASFEAPLVKGHPRTDAPAFGWIDKLKRKGQLLLAKLKNISPQLKEEVKNGMFKKISIALYPDLMLRHVGILGAAAPAVKGLKNVQFNDEQDFESYEIADGRQQAADSKEKGERKKEKEFSDMQNKISELENENLRLKTNLEFNVTETRLKEFREFANSLIEGERGPIITPAQAEDIIGILENAYQSDINEFNKFHEFNEFSNYPGLVKKIMNIFNELKEGFCIRGNDMTKALEYAHKQDVTKPAFGDKDAGDDFKGLVNVRPERLELHQRARVLQSGNNGLTYEEALNKVLSVEC